ncbi:hypothetical protein [Ottowia thiooxydans]|uniref:IPTL-CTERM protein sorting domain-containing protein n=1 Tax=Ottowia thiooxydans TaxID=219182 RepID=A0ABV2Q389_9BURK
MNAIFSNRLPRRALALATLLVCSFSVQAVQQCLTRGPGTYGSVTVSGCADDQAHGVWNPMGAAQFPPSIPWPYSYEGIGLGVNENGAFACSLNFSHPINTSSIRLMLEGHQALDVLSISTSTGPYTPVPSDISALPGGVSPGPLVISGNTIVGTEMISSGIVRLTNNVPVTITSLTLQENTGDLGTLIGVCFDDAASAPVPAPEVTAVPTASEWVLGGLALLCGMLGMRRLAGRRSQA